MLRLCALFAVSIAAMTVLTSLYVTHSQWSTSTLRAHLRGKEKRHRQPAVYARRVNASALNGKVDPKCKPAPDSERRAHLDILKNPPPSCDTDDQLCEAIATCPERLFGEPAASRQLVVTVARWPEQRHFIETFTAAAAALQVPTCVLLVTGNVAAGAVGAEVRQQSDLETAGVVLVGMRSSAATPTPIALKWAALAALLTLHVAVLYADVDAVLTHPPFDLLAHDSDVEVASEAWDDEAARGFIHGSDDPSMGWGRYAESMRIAFFAPSLLFLQPTAASLALARLLAHLARAQRWAAVEGTAWEAADETHGEAKSLTFEASSAQAPPNALPCLTSPYPNLSQLAPPCPTLRHPLKHQTPCFLLPAAADQTLLASRHRPSLATPDGPRVEICHGSSWPLPTTTFRARARACESCLTNAGFLAVLPKRPS